MKRKPYGPPFQTPDKSPEAELREQGGILRGLIDLASTIREVARSVESIAWEADRERRGALSAGSRTDASGIALTIADLLRGDLLADDGRRDLHDEVRGMLDPKFARRRERAIAAGFGLSRDEVAQRERRAVNRARAIAGLPPTKEPSTRGTGVLGRTEEPPKPYRGIEVRRSTGKARKAGAA